MQTGPIIYRATDRGRKFRGAERNFDTAALAKVINSGEVQERVKNRDMWGYTEHWPRIAFGMIPGAGGAVTRGPLAGKVIPLQPTFITTSLQAEPDGTITHEAEFQNNAFGRVAYRAWNNRTAGFSSCIDCAHVSGVDVPRGFYGFDWVGEPNFTGNRGYALDGVFEDEEASAMLMDSVSAQRALIAITDGAYRTLQSEYDRQAETLEHLENQNRDLVSMVASLQEKHARLDSAVVAHAAPMVNRVSRLQLMADDFKTMKLDGVEPPPEDAEQRAYTGMLAQAKRLLRTW